MPSVLGLVSIMAATSSFISSFSSFISTRPWLSDFMVRTLVNPAMRALAGLVPWAESGTKIVLRVRPFIWWYFWMSINPTSSPCAPAAGCKVMPEKPLSSSRYSCKSYISSNAPCADASGCSGCSAANCSSAATCSLIFGLYFIVQLPSG